MLRWLRLATLAAIGGLVFVALLQCAVADLVIRVAAWLYATSEDRSTKREEWRRLLTDLRPSERPAEAGSPPMARA